LFDGLLRAGGRGDGGKTGDGGGSDGRTDGKRKLHCGVPPSRRAASAVLREYANIIRGFSREQQVKRRLRPAHSLGWPFQKNAVECLLF
jgi:hypothetical protein